MFEINLGARHALAIGLSFRPACIGMKYNLYIARLNRRISQFVLAEILAVVNPAGKIAF